jgi:hypothetical protein
MAALLQLYWGCLFYDFWKSSVFIPTLKQLCCSFIETFFVYDFQVKSVLLRLYCNYIAALLQIYWGLSALQFSSTKCFYRDFIAALSRLCCSMSISGLNTYPLPMSYFITALLWPLLWLYSSCIPSYIFVLAWPIGIATFSRLYCGLYCSLGRFAWSPSN